MRWRHCGATPLRRGRPRRGRRCSPTGWRASSTPRDDELDDCSEVQAALEGFAEQLRRSELAPPLPLEVVRSALAQALDDPARGGVPDRRRHLLRR